MANDLTPYNPPKPTAAPLAVESGLKFLPKRTATQLASDPEREAIIRECRDVVAAEAPARPEVFALIIERMAVHFPENKLTPQEQKLVLKDWRRLLGEMPPDILQATADAYVMSVARFFPTPGQFNAVAGPLWLYRKALAKRARETLAVLA